VRVGAIVTVPGGTRTEDSAFEDRSCFPYLFRYPLACHDILGETLLQRTLNSLRDSGVQQRTVLFEETGSESLFPSRVPSVGEFFSAWEASVGQQLDRGAEILLLIRLGAYLELDYGQLLDFHRQTSGVLTQVYDQKSAFEIAVVNTNQLQGDKGSYRGRLSAVIPYHRRYEFSGYSNRLREPQDFRRLVRDALLHRNSIRPVGEEVSPEIWFGEGTTVDATSRISAPAYIGAHTRVKGSCLINGATSIERDCEVDFGTTVTDSCVLPETYVGIGLNLVHSIVTANKLFHLDRNVEIEILDRNLVGKQRSIRTLTKSIAKKDYFNWNERQLNRIDSHL
jgi:carbonic anhydrase/acetyltransferase-like protein (isoleucine patch superfamily)